MTAPRIVQYARAFGTLTFTSFRRLLWSVGTLMLVFPPAACALWLVWRNYGAMSDEVEAFNGLSNFLIKVFASFVMPLCCVTFGATAVGGDRDDGTLLFLLMRPLPRGLIIAAKMAAALPLSVAFTCGSLWIFCKLAGPPGTQAWEAYLPAVFLMTVAYTALFLFFGTLVRHAAIVGLIYTLLMEVFLGNVPGIIKQIAVNYYGRSLMYDAGVDYGLTAPDPQWFDPMSASTARWTLCGIAATAWCAAWLVFQFREYEDAE